MRPSFVPEGSPWGPANNSLTGIAAAHEPLLHPRGYYMLAFPESKLGLLPASTPPGVEVKTNASRGLVCHKGDGYSLSLAGSRYPSSHHTDSSPRAWSGNVLLGCRATDLSEVWGRSICMVIILFSHDHAA
jgi:hypothetical protein